MTRADIMQALDQEIERLQQVKRLLAGTGGISPALSSLVGQRSSKPARVMSEEGRRRIAEAQKRRWAKVRRVE